MCTEFCLCPGSPTDAHYNQYKELNASVYDEVGRSFNPKIVGGKQIGLLWTYNKRNDQNRVGFESIASDNMLKCFENAQTIADKVS